jgi:hypothetical protein
MPIPLTLFGEVGSVGNAMLLTVGTFNLNNLFSRFNLEADVSTAVAHDGAALSHQEVAGSSPASSIRSCAAKPFLAKT